jgi:hypothetical protein
MKPLVTTRKRFAPLLAELGFAEIGPPLRYRRVLADRVQFLDVEKERWFGALHFTLSEQAETLRTIDLRRFEDLPRFEYSDPPSLARCIELAYANFSAYGIRWLSGEDVLTPAIERCRREAAQAGDQRLIQEARAHFKAGRYVEAVALFLRVSDGLDPVSERMFTLAQRKMGWNDPRT